MAKHQNTGKCPACQDFLKLARPELKAWFEPEQDADPSLHISCATRGRADQENDFTAGKSRAHYGESPHNYYPSWAIDLFFILGGNASWVMSKYQALASRVPAWITWGADWNHNGRTDDEKFKDGPHFEVTGWKRLELRYPKGSV